MDQKSLQYPIGDFAYKPNVEISSFIERIASAPERIQELVENLDSSALNWRYRPGGWKLYTLVHHISDSHLNAYIRIKMAYTESGKSIAPYDEKAWAKLDEHNEKGVFNSIQLLFSLHRRWVTFLRQLSPKDLDKTYFHPANKENVTIREAIQQYAWHSDHHIAHLKQGILARGKYDLDE